MEKLQVRLLVLIVFGTISGSKEVVGLHSDSVTVVPARSATPPLGCGPPKPPVSVRFHEIKVEGSGSDVVYHRVTVTLSHLQFAMNASVSLPSRSLVECAKTAASEGLEAFAFDGNCTGYQLTRQFPKCRAGDLEIYQRSDNFADVSAVTTIDDAPFELVDNGDDDPYRLYHLYSFVEVDDDHRTFERVDSFDVNEASSSENLISLENGEAIKVYYLVLDVNFCLNDGAYGLPIVVAEELEDLVWPIVYFFQECGNTVQVARSGAFSDAVVYSHPGFGCKYYPTGLPDDCTVIFEGEDSKKKELSFNFYFSETDSDAAGLNMTITGINPTTGDTETENMYDPSVEIGNMCCYPTYTVSLHRQPSKRAIGFFFEIY